MAAPTVSPGFPKGLRVLLVDEQHSKSIVEAQLRQPELQYAVTSVTSAAEALSYLRTGVAAFDVVLAESRLVALEEAVGRTFVDAFEDTPVVLMSACGSSDDVMRAVKLGAVDFLDKPLSLLKLKNIWQHSVRKMMVKAAGPRAERCTSPPAPSPSFWTSGAGGSAASLGPESPGTPTAASADLPEMLGMYDDSAANSARSSMDCGGGGGESFMEAMTSALAAPAAPAVQLPRPAPFAALTAPPLSGGQVPAAPFHWPMLQPGCVWGTPANGPVPPPLPGAARTAPAPAATTSTWTPAPSVMQPAPAAAAPTPVAAPEPGPVLIKTGSSGILPVAAAKDELVIPEGFFSEAAVAKSNGGPLGLQLKKSPSLLNLINSTLETSNAYSQSFMGLAAMIF